MKPPTGIPSLTSTWHNDTYPAISPTNPALSAEGKTVIVTGGGRGLGVEMARAFAIAGAHHVALLGRTRGTLLSTKTSLENEHPKLKVTTHVADVADENDVQNAAKEVGAWDVLVLNAGLQNLSKPVAKSSVTDWWRVFETNVKGAFVTCHAFLPSHRASASIIGINAALAQFAPNTGYAEGASAYAASKMAQMKLLEHIAAENPDMFVASVHPGIIATDMPAGAKMDLKESPMDDIKLPAHFVVWSVSPEAKFLKGRFVWANWDVDELKAKAKEIEGSLILTSNVLGWPFAP